MYLSVCIATMLEFTDLPGVLRDAAARLPIVTLPLHDGLGRVLAAPSFAAWDLPRFDSSALDGYAVILADTKGASDQAPARLRLVGTAYAGQGVPDALSPGSAVRIATGGVAPAGADGIAPRETAGDDGATVEVRAPAGPHIRRAGEELRAGSTVLEAGTRLGPLQIAALAAAGVTQVTVARTPRVVVLATGAELVPVGQRPEPSQITDSNGPLVATWLARRLYLPAIPAQRVTDDRDATQAALAAAFADADVVVTSGGVSVGDHDVVRPAAAALGFEIIVPKLAIKPGKPVFVGRRGAQWLIGLPGNPAAVAIGLHIVAAPLLALLEGDAAWWPAKQPLRAATPIARDSKRSQLIWARRHGDQATILARGGSHMLSDLATADVLLVVAPGSGAVEVGDVVDSFSLT